MLNDCETRGVVTGLTTKTWLGPDDLYESGDSEDDSEKTGETELNEAMGTLIPTAETFLDMN